MSKNSGTTYICDCCKTTVFDNGQVTYGGNVRQGWTEVHLIDGRTTVGDIHTKKDFDFCCYACLSSYMGKINVN
jgi:hypothetical protein